MTLTATKAKLGDAKEQIEAALSEYSREETLERLVSELEKNGFRRESEASAQVGAAEAIVYRDGYENIVMIVDSFSLDGDPKVPGYLAVLQNGDTAVQGILMAVPNEERLHGTLVAMLDHGLELEVVKPFTKTFSPVRLPEIYQHEYQHLSDLIEANPWGAVLVRHAVSEAASAGLEVQDHYRWALTEPAPSTAEVSAATLVSELRAYSRSPTTNPDLCQKALVSLERIEAGRLSGNREEIYLQLREWKETLSGVGGKISLLSEKEDLDIAANWAMQLDFRP